MFELTTYGKGLLTAVKADKPVHIEQGGHSYNLRKITQAQMAALYKDGSAIIQKVEKPLKVEKVEKPKAPEPPALTE